MGQTFRIRDTQRFIFLPLLFPLMPLMLQVIHPAWTVVLVALEGMFVVWTFWMLFRERELRVLGEEIVIDRGRWEQRVSHEQVQEIFLNKGQVVQLRIEGRNRYVRVLQRDYAGAVAALQEFGWRNAVPVTDRRPRGSERKQRGESM